MRRASASSSSRSSGGRARPRCRRPAARTTRPAAFACSYGAAAGCGRRRTAPSARSTVATARLARRAPPAELTKAPKRTRVPGRIGRRAVHLGRSRPSPPAAARPGTGRPIGPSPSPTASRSSSLLVSVGPVDAVQRHNRDVASRQAHAGGRDPPNRSPSRPATRPPPAGAGQRDRAAITSSPRSSRQRLYLGHPVGQGEPSSARHPWRRRRTSAAGVCARRPPEGGRGRFVVAHRRSGTALRSEVGKSRFDNTYRRACSRPRRALHRVRDRDLADQVRLGSVAPSVTLITAVPPCTPSRSMRKAPPSCCSAWLSRR
jgi:hypothetical protein